MVIDSHDYFMCLAIAEAWKYQGLTYPNPAVGCAVVSKERGLLSVEAHQRAGEAHAEVNALCAAYYKLTNDSAIFDAKSSQEKHDYLLKNHNNLFRDITLYTTLEPCAHRGKTPSCASLINALGIKEVYVGSLDANPIAKGGNTILRDANCRVWEQVCAKECDALLHPFLCWSRENFIFFKWAQRLDATVDGGVISSEESRKYVHAMRDVCDLIVVGGETVRSDRPTLDARLVSGKAPDVLIISRSKEFESSIPLFHVPNRRVFVESDFEKLKEYKNVLIEGGSKMFELTKEFVDLYLCFIAPAFGGASVMGLEHARFEFLNTRQAREDIIIWMKRVED